MSPDDIGTAGAPTGESGNKGPAGVEFTEDWTTNKLDLWLPVLAEMRDEPTDILEAGTFEGRSAIALLDYMPKSRITCIDHFKDADVEGRFDRNMAAYGDRVTKRKGSAVVIMEQLRRKHASYDLIYLDCAKERTGAFIVSALGWHMLKVGGIIIWDDLNWQKTRNPARRAEPGSKLFIKTFWRSMKVLHHPVSNPRWSGQLIARKVSDDWPDYELPDM
ncbi:O-methyltransferase [Mycoplana dimorpha]|uniref:O-methyltransferase n=1 Tax=Mycoplana dimorpha TaxID=28320 RepID=UPI000D391B9F|nr:class I SAM-dependent methyltransferase [Mycoplana dimorpha]